ncbi:MAG: DUF4330 domain-containing protein [Bacillota bacterium]|nr:DUF4330 domain-containing protein [Bacillota bacterium]
MAKEKKIHFNFIDILIIIGFVIAVLGFSFYAMGHWQSNPANNVENNKKMVTYILYAKNVPPEVADSIKVGDELKDASKNMTKGKIIEIRSKKKYVDDDAFDKGNGVYAPAQHPENYSMELVMKSGYSMKKDTVMIDNSELKLCIPMMYRTDRYAINAYVSKIITD